MNIYQKMLEVRKRIDYLKKENKGYEYSYVSSSQAISAVRGAMDEFGIILIPEINFGAVEKFESKKGGNQFHTSLSMSYSWVNADDPSDKITVSWYAQGTDSSERGVGKALTYAEKYIILKTFQIATDLADPDAFQERKLSRMKSAADLAETVKSVATAFENTQVQCTNIPLSAKDQAAKSRAEKERAQRDASGKAMAILGAYGFSQRDLERYVEKPAAKWQEPELKKLRELKLKLNSIESNEATMQFVKQLIA